MMIVMKAVMQTVEYQAAHGTLVTQAGATCSTGNNDNPTPDPGMFAPPDVNLRRR